MRPVAHSNAIHGSTSARSATACGNIRASTRVQTWRGGSNPTEVAVYPHQVPATTVDDDHNQITAITAAKCGALAVTYTRTDAW
jgi:hypothetical protein